MSLISADTLRPYKIANDWVWYYYSVVGVVPLFALALYKWRRPLEWKHYEDKAHPKNWLQDRLAYYFMVYAWFYYLLDSAFTLVSMQFTDQCRFHLWLHHVICIFALPYVFALGHYPYFVLTLPAHHALLIAFPDCEPLNYIYGVFILMYQYQAQTKYFQRRHYYQVINWSIVLLYVPLFGMWYNECKNYIPDYTF